MATKKATPGPRPWGRRAITEWAGAGTSLPAIIQPGCSPSYINQSQRGCRLSLIPPNIMYGGRGTCTREEYMVWYDTLV